ncbi:hypothetical protein R3F72_15110 [Salinicola sp. 4072]|uniref:hypothetical protein n=1 Tax=Salinicola sp. 4072 TaxID=3082157 RepID=UPI002FC9430F
MNWLPTLFETWLREASSNTVTGIFFSLIMACFVISLYCYKQDKLRSLTHYTPNLLTSLGMLGTFIGIVIGLLHFDPNDIDGSISLLLGGLQTAFMTSLFGMGMTIIYKFFISVPQMQPRADLATGPDEIGPEHIHQLMREQNDNLDRLRHAIAGDDSDTLMGQIRLMRQSQDDGQQRLVREVSRQAEAVEQLGRHAETQRTRFDEFARELSQQMHDFAEMMSKSATEQVIEALNKVIRDFNEKLTEQFGKNFEELNDAVKLMVEWQENYRQQLTEMRDQYAQGVTAISDTEKSVANISVSAGAIPQAMAGLETLLTTTQRQLADLEAHLSAFADMRDRAIEAVPEINAQVEKTVADISQAALSAASQLVSGSESLKKELVEGSANINAEMIDGASGLNERYNSVHETLQGTSDHLSIQAEQITIRLTEGNERIASQLEDQHRRTAELFEGLHATLEKNATQLNEGAERLSETHRMGIEHAEQQVKTLIDQLSQHSSQLARQLGEAGEETQSQLRQSQALTQEQLENLQSQHRKALEEASQQYQNQLNSTQQQFNGILQEIAQTTSASLDNQIKALDDSMQEELTRALTQMGNQLAQITGRFTEDYSRLTNEMQKVVNQASQAGVYQ